MVGTIVFSILEKELRHREIKYLGSGHTPGRGGGQDLTLEPLLFITTSPHRLSCEQNGLLSDCGSSSLRFWWGGGRAKRNMEGEGG